MTFDPQVVQLFDAMREANLPTIDRLPLDQARLSYRMQSERAGSPVLEMAAVRDLAAEGPAGPIPLRLYRPRGVAERGAPALVFFHGGGCVIGDLETHDRVCREMAERGACLVVAVDYRLAPEHTAPAATEDASAAVRWVARNADALGADARRLAVGGDSAGGNLAAVAALRARDEGVALRAQILIYPSVDVRGAEGLYPSRTTNAGVPPLTQALMQYFRVRYLPDPAAGEAWRLSPILAPDKAGTAPALVITAERDILHDEGVAYAAALSAAGVPVTHVDVPGMIHGFITLGGALDAAPRTLAAIGAELRTRFAGP